MNEASAQQPEPTNTVTVTGAAECHPDRDGRWIAGFASDADSTDPANTWTLPVGWTDAGTPLSISVDRSRQIVVSATTASFSLSTLATFANGPQATSNSLTLFRPDGCDGPVEPTNSLAVTGVAECVRELDGRWLATFIADAESSDPANTWQIVGSPSAWSFPDGPVALSQDRRRSFEMAPTDPNLNVAATASFATGPTVIDGPVRVERPDDCVLVNSGQIEATAACATTDGQVRLTVALTAGSAQSNEYTVTATNQTWSPAADTVAPTSSPRSSSIDVPDDADYTVTATLEWLVGVDTVVDTLVYSAGELDCSNPVQPNADVADAAPVAVPPVAAPAAPAPTAPVAPAGSLPETGRATEGLLFAALIVSLSGLLAVRLSRRPVG